MPSRRRSSEQDEERHLRCLRRMGRHVPIQSRPHPLVGWQLRQPQVQVQPLHHQVQSLEGLLLMQLLRLLELQLQCVHNQEAQSRRLAHRVEERRRALQESQRAWAKEASIVLLLERVMHWCANVSSEHFNQIVVCKTVVLQRKDLYDFNSHQV